MYDSSFFHSETKRKVFITDDHIQKIKGLKSHRSDQSGYYDVMLQWRQEDNPQFTKSRLNDLYPVMQFIVMTATLKSEFVQKWNIQPYHVSLLRRLYLDWDDDCITMGYKRPFGNSHVLGDVREEVSYSTDTQEEEILSEDYTQEEKILLEFIDILDDLFKEEGFELNIRAFESISRSFPDLIGGLEQWNGYLNFDRLHWYLRSWTPDKLYIRDQKIEKILK